MSTHNQRTCKAMSHVLNEDHKFEYKEVTFLVDEPKYVVNNRWFSGNKLTFAEMLDEIASTDHVSYIRQGNHARTTVYKLPEKLMSETLANIFAIYQDVEDDLLQDIDDGPWTIVYKDRNKNSRKFRRFVCEGPFGKKFNRVKYFKNSKEMAEFIHKYITNLGHCALDFYFSSGKITSKFSTTIWSEKTYGPMLFRGEPI